MVTTSENLKAIGKNGRKYCVNKVRHRQTQTDGHGQTRMPMDADTLGDGKPQ